MVCSVGRMDEKRVVPVSAGVNNPAAFEVRGVPMAVVLLLLWLVLDKGGSCRNDDIKAAVVGE